MLWGPSRHLGSSTAANWVSFDLNVSCSSCWGYSLINTLKLKKISYDWRNWRHTGVILVILERRNVASCAALYCCKLLCPVPPGGISHPLAFHLVVPVTLLKLILRCRACITSTDRSFQHQTPVCSQASGRRKLGTEGRRWIPEGQWWIRVSDRCRNRTQN